VPAGLCLLAWPVTAQVKVGEFSSHLSGTIAPGYSADFGNMTSSDHSWALGGDATLSGFFYNPNFLSYNAAVYVNQSRANSDYQSISDATGINVTATLFGGSRFPGAINYSKAFNSEGNYAVPGAANYVTHGNSDTFGVNWSENLPNVPSFSAGFQLGGSQYSVYGTDDTGNSNFHSLNLQSAYSLAGFNMGTYFADGGGHSLVPEVVTGQQETETTSQSSGYGFSIAHQLPLNGSATAAINRSSWGTDYQGTNSTGTIDLINALASVHPFTRLSFSASANYSDNLAGQLIQSVIAAGGAVSGLNSDQGSDSLDLEATASYVPAKNLRTSAYVERRSQSFQGASYGEDTIGATGAYSRKLFAGSLNATGTLTENTSDQSQENIMGFSTSENYSNEIRGWKVNGSFNYSQNVETLLVTYMNSSFSYSGNAQRRWDNFNVSVSAGSSRTGLTQQAGTASSSQNYSLSTSLRTWVSATGSYSKSSGQAIATGAGLVTVPVPSPVIPSSEISLYGGDSYSVGLSSTPIRRLVLAASYAKSNSNTTTDGAASTNLTDQYNLLVQYRFRKLYCNTGFARLGQGFSGSGIPSESISSFYIGVSRWFNFF